MVLRTSRSPRICGQIRSLFRQMWQQRNRIWRYEGRYLCHLLDLPSVDDERRFCFHYEFESSQSYRNLLQLLNVRHQKKRDQAHSVVGTGNYMAPEVILKIGRFRSLASDSIHSLHLRPLRPYNGAFQVTHNFVTGGQWVWFSTRWFLGGHRSCLWRTIRRRPSTR